MSKAVIVLGAGASASFGLPTLRRLFQDINARQYLNENVFLDNQLKDLFWEPRGHTLETSDQSLTIEDILTVLRDYEKQNYDAPLLTRPDLEKFRKSLYILIKKATYDDKSSEGRHLNRWIDHFGSACEAVTWASFNWDCIFESSFYYCSGDDVETRTNPQVVVRLKNWFGSSSHHTLLKLHGGVNWWYDREGIEYLPFGRQLTLNARWREYGEDRASGHPVILEPSSYKYDDPVYQLLKEQWDVFVRRLLEANDVVIIGYSLPEADAKARTALMMGFQSNATSKWLVVNSDPEVCARYGRLFGTKRVTIFNRTLADFNRNFEQALHVANM
jgi:hypothetical protein